MKNPLKTPSLEDRIRQMQDECNALIDRHVAELKKVSEGVPDTVLRRMVENRAPGCPCQQARYVEGLD